MNINYLQSSCCLLSLGLVGMIFIVVILSFLQHCTTKTSRQTIKFGRRKKKQKSNNTEPRRVFLFQHMVAKLVRKYEEWRATQNDFFNRDSSMKLISASEISFSGATENEHRTQNYLSNSGNSRQLNRIFLCGQCVYYVDYFVLFFFFKYETSKLVVLLQPICWECKHQLIVGKVFNMTYWYYGKATENPQHTHKHICLLRMVIVYNGARSSLTMCEFSCCAPVKKTGIIGNICRCFDAFAL